ncbi:TetR family transcriptional regulator [Actinorhabdospora filicis]|uniref:TetR family transcriptional regulator n=1 Tax=Actinorhabdospora filicis TaxID=1785913 RepID=A0A9W6SQ40_9ACTN|nr:TetR/AcrR family transcriptional regulator [Actinorhabdospora filicis]GLZ78686.1 TetR family transcriptional regulator [Actinorhabdospora filicis]
MTDSGTPPMGKVSARQRRSVQRRMDILRAAMGIFGRRGYMRGSLIEIAEVVGITHAGILHHFGSKDELLLEVLRYRDEADFEELAVERLPEGLELFDHLVRTARLNATRPGIVQSYAVLSAESVTDDHPGQEWFRNRFAGLRRILAEALREVCAGHEPGEERLDAAASVIIALMDGLQVQWLLDREAVDLAYATALGINAVLADLTGGKAVATG